MKIQVPFAKLGFPFLEIETEDENNPLLQNLPELGLAIVGTRYPQKKSFDLLEKTIKELAHTNLIIVSGFARGIDSRAHELALDHGLNTIAIVGCGLNIDYPKENRLLRKRILSQGGMIISPYSDGTPALPRNFLERNQLIAFFAKAIWVVEASAISGTLNTAKHAANLGKDLYATSCFPGDPFMEGNQKLISQMHTDKHPIAQPFFDSQTFQHSWPHLGIQAEKKTIFDRTKLTRIQRWVLNMKDEYGDCRIQSLMNFAIDQGITPGQFYIEYSQELKEGKLKEDLLGSVDLP